MRIALSILLLCSLLHAEVTIYTEDLPPYQYKKNEKSELDGVAISIVRAMLERLKHPDTIELTSWNRAYETVQKYNNVAAFPASRTPEREDLFLWVGPIFQASNRFLSHYDSNISLDNIEKAKPYTVGVVKQSSRHLRLEILGFPKIITHYNSMENYRAILNQRVDLIVGNPLVAEFQTAPLISKLGRLSDTGLELYHSDVYLIFNHDSDGERVKRWQQTLEDMKKDGSYDTIYQEALKRARLMIGL